MKFSKNTCAWLYVTCVLNLMWSTIASAAKRSGDELTKFLSGLHENQRVSVVDSQTETKKIWRFFKTYPTTLYTYAMFWPDESYETINQPVCDLAAKYSFSKEVPPFPTTEESHPDVDSEVHVRSAESAPESDEEDAMVTDDSLKRIFDARDAELDTVENQGNVMSKESVLKFISHLKRNDLVSVTNQRTGLHETWQFISAEKSIMYNEISLVIFRPVINLSQDSQQSKVGEQKCKTIAELANMNLREWEEAESLDLSDPDDEKLESPPPWNELKDLGAGKELEDLGAGKELSDTSPENEEPPSQTSSRRSQDDQPRQGDNRSDNSEIRSSEAVSGTIVNAVARASRNEASSKVNQVQPVEIGSADGLHTNLSETPELGFSNSIVSSQPVKRAQAPPTRQPIKQLLKDIRDPTKSTSQKSRKSKAASKAATKPPSKGLKPMQFSYKNFSHLIPKIKRFLRKHKKSSKWGDVCQRLLGDDGATRIDAILTECDTSTAAMWRFIAEDIVVRMIEYENKTGQKNLAQLRNLKGQSQKEFNEFMKTYTMWAPKSENLTK